MYRAHIQLTPEIHRGQMRYYWHIDLHNEEGQFTVKSGWGATITGAAFSMQVEATKLMKK